jgi:hypothetical protein
MAVASRKMRLNQSSDQVAGQKSDVQPVQYTASTLPVVEIVEK